MLLGTGRAGENIRQGLFRNVESADDVDGRLHAGDRVLALVLEVRAHLSLGRELQHTSNPSRFEPVSKEIQGVKEAHGRRLESIWSLNI